MSDIVISPGWASYLRVSDEDKQTPERSFAFQRKHIQDSLLASSNVEFKREYCDMLTGTSPNRADYQQMLSDAQAGKFSHLGLYRADRFGRNAVEGLQAATKLISWGIKVRVANMPTLQPETPDGFFMFLLQMGLAQREVDVLRERTRDGMEAKMRMGGWPNKAPFGYVNKEKLVSSNKYDRWVEQDPNSIQALKDAWDLLLTGRYTLDQICEELTQRGYTTYSGRPWAWNDPKTGRREYAANRLHKILHNPFYAGWVTSKRFGIVAGEVRGNWEAIITPNQFQKGVDILRKNGSEKSYERKNFYLLRGLLWAEVNGERYKLHGSTPSGRSQSYSYYITHAKPGGTSLHIPSKLVDGQIVDLLQGIEIDADLIPEIRKVYVQEVQQYTNQDREKQVADMRQRLSQLKEEEARLGRLLITGKITEEAYDQLRLEWQEKLRNVELGLAELERDAKVHLDDLDLAIGLLRELVDYYFWLEDKQKATLLQILFKRLVVDEKGSLIDYELNSPFVYLRSLADRFGPPSEPSSGSVHIREGAQAALRRCSPTRRYAHVVGRICFKDIIRSMILQKRLLRIGLMAALLAACAAQSAPAPATSLPTQTATLAVPATPTATATAPAEPPRLIAAGELYQDVADDMAESFLDVIEFQAVVDDDTETLQVVFRLRDLPDNVTRRQVLNFVEYWWELSIYFAAPLQPDAQPDAGMLVDTFASDPSAQSGEGIHTPVPGTPEVVPLNELWDDRFAYTAAGEILGVPEVVGDPSADTVTLTAQIPGITSSAVFTFSTFHFDGSMDRPDNYVDMAGPAAPIELTVNAYPGPHHYEGDVLTFEVKGLDGTSDLAELSLDGGLPFRLSGQWLTHDTLLLPLALDTRGLTGSHELTLTFQDGAVSHIYSLDLLPAAQRPPNESNAVWLTEEIDCCSLHYLSNTAAARDINFIAQNFSIAAEEILSQYQASIATKLDVYVIDRMWGNGGFGSPGELVISYTDRYYGPTVGVDGLQTLARHEITHAASIGLDHAGDGVEFNVEGLAVFLAGGHYKTEPLALRGAAMHALGYQPPIDGFVGQHEVDYLHGAALLTYISETYGLESIWALMAADSDPADGQITSLGDAVQETFGISLARLDQDFKQWLAAQNPGEQLDDLRLTIELQELRRSYQLAYSPPPMFIAGPAHAAIAQPDYLPVVLREANAPFNMAAELMIAAGQRAIIDGDYARAQAIVDSLAQVLETQAFADPLAKDFIDIVTVLASQGYEVASLDIRGDRATAEVFVQAPELIELTLARSSGLWQLTD